jgi:hypothetical protein
MKLHQTHQSLDRYEGMSALQVPLHAIKRLFEAHDTEYRCYPTAGADFRPDSPQRTRRDRLSRLPQTALSRNLVLVSDKSERRAARSVVADYHDAQLRELVDRVGDAIDRYRAGELDALEIDRVVFQYSRAAKELWKFCNYLQVEVAARMIREQPPNDWWERGAPRER